MTLEESLRRDYLDQPNEVSLETQTVCNAACTFCPYPQLERIGNRMSDDMIYSIIDQMAEFPRPFMFSPFKMSDPLLDKRMYSILRRVNDRVPKAHIRIFTNGSALTLKRAEELHNIDRVEVWVSLNTHRPEEYRELMGLDFDRVAKNLDALHETDFRHPVQVNRVGADDEFVAYVRKRWPLYRPFVIKRDSWLGFTEAERTEVPDKPCARWFELSIMSDGRVALCCMDSDGTYSIGDVTKQRLLEVYNSPGWRDRRERFISRKEIFPCSTCTY